MPSGAVRALVKINICENTSLIQFYFLFYEIKKGLNTNA